MCSIPGSSYACMVCLRHIMQVDHLAHLCTLTRTVHFCLFCAIVCVPLQAPCDRPVTSLSYRPCNLLYIQPVIISSFSQACNRLVTSLLQACEKPVGFSPMCGVIVTMATWHSLPCMHFMRQSYRLT